MIWNRKGKIGESVQETFQENMQMEEDFQCLSQVKEDRRNATQQKN